MSLAHAFARTKQILEQEGNLPAIDTLDARPRARLALDFVAQFPPSALIFLSLLTLAVCFFWNQVPEAEREGEAASLMEPDPALEAVFPTGASGIAKGEDIDDSIFDSPGMRIVRRARPLVRSKFTSSVTLVMKSYAGLVGYFFPAYIILCFGFSNFLPYVENAGVRVGAVAFGAQLACVWRWRSFGSNVLPIFRAGT